MTTIEKAATEKTALHMNPNAKQTDYHPNNYFRRDNDALRPAPDRVKNNPAWYPMRKFLLNGLRPLGKYTPPTMVGDYPDRVNDLYWQGDELAEEVKYLKKPNAVTKHLPKLLRGWAKVNSMRGKYRPNERWSHRFHHEGAFINGYKKFMLIRDDETNVDFKSHDNTKASDLGKKSAFSS